MRRLVTVVFMLVMAITVVGCHKETEEDKIRKVITDIQKAAEEKDVKKIISNLSKTYSDPQGFNYETIKRPLLGYFLMYPKISVYISNLNISVKGIAARTSFRTVLTSTNKTGSPTDLIPQSLGMYDFNISLKKESDGWKVTSAAWAHVEMTNTNEADDS